MKKIKKNIVNISKNIRVGGKTNLRLAKKYLLEFAYTILDLIFLAFLLTNFKNSKVAKKKKITIVTAADKSHYLSANQLINSVLRNTNNTIIYFFDLDQEAEFDYSSFDRDRFKYKKFEFNKYPDFFNFKFHSEYDGTYKLGYYAWKAIATKEIADIESGILIWCDAGNIIKKDLNLVKKVINKNHFYSPISSDRVKDWTHHSLIARFNLSNNILNKRNLWSCFVCFDLDSEFGKFMVKEWSIWSQQRILIAPEGSSRSNHRQDQTLITLIYYLNKGEIYSPKTYKIFNLRFQRDLESN